MTETRPIPKTALTAVNLLRQQMQAAVNELGHQVIADLGLSAEDRWNVNFDTGTMTREVPDIAPAQDATT